ncbi:MAG: helix-turn-helix domain-containing protein [Acidobacteriota bacterium]
MTLASHLESLVNEMIQKGITLEQAASEFERRYIARAVERANGNKGDAAKLLGVHRNTLASKLNNHKAPTRKTRKARGR